MNIVQYKKVDEVILKLGKRISLLRHLNPRNAHIEKKRFFNNIIKNPAFIYTKPHYDTEEFEEILLKLSPPKDILGNILQDEIEVLRKKNEIVKNRGNSDIVQKLSKELYPKPNQKLVTKAKKLIKQIHHKKNIAKNNKKILTAHEVIASLQSFLQKLQLHEWSISTSRLPSVSISSIYKKISISTKKQYSRQDVQVLKAHEILGHIFRTENGRNQPLKIFGFELPNYLATEEGLATYLEEKFNVETQESKLRFALRVLAIDLVNKGASFRECFNEINKYEDDKNNCWETTIRVFRGGGYLKDHVYLQGYYKVKDYLENGGNIRMLYIGKIGLEHIDLCRKLLKDDLLHPPEYIPNERHIEQ